MYIYIYSNAGGLQSRRSAAEARAAVRAHRRPERLDYNYIILFCTMLYYVVMYNHI